MFISLLLIIYPILENILVKVNFSPFYFKPIFINLISFFYYASSKKLTL